MIFATESLQQQFNVELEMADDVYDCETPPMNFNDTTEASYENATNWAGETTISFLKSTLSIRQQLHSRVTTVSSHKIILNLILCNALLAKGKENFKYFRNEDNIRKTSILDHEMLTFCILQSIHKVITLNRLILKLARNWTSSKQSVKQANVNSSDELNVSNTKYVENMMDLNGLPYGMLQCEKTHNILVKYTEIILMER